jgi:hypothetical protein
MTTTQDLVAITGNTYPVKDALKAIGARWNADRKCWMIAPDKADKARQIVSGSNTAPSAPRGCNPPPRPAPAPSPYAGTKYQVRPKPVSKYAPLFGADTLEEIVVWLDANTQWNYSGTNGGFQTRGKGYTDIAVCTRGTTMDGSGENLISKWMPCKEDYDLCHRVTPGRENNFDDR